MAFLEIPGLPEKQVSLCAVSSRFPSITEALAGEGIEVLTVPPLSVLPAPVASHADLQLMPLGGNRVLAAEEAAEPSKQLRQKGYEVVINDLPLGDRYPQDISLNFLVVEKMVFGHQKAMSHTLKNIILENRWHFLYSRQGYARCSVCLVSSNSAITSDPTLYGLLTAAGLDVLKLPPGDILLPGYDTGFIGGCCGLIHPRRMAFTGSLEYYHCGMAVVRFLERYQIEPVFLRKGKLLDVGGIIPLATVD